VHLTICFSLESCQEPHNSAWNMVRPSCECFLFCICHLFNLSQCSSEWKIDRQAFVLFEIAVENKASIFLKSIKTRFSMLNYKNVLSRKNLGLLSSYRLCRKELKQFDGYIQSDVNS
jgi:hypothetical protein